MKHPAELPSRFRTASGGNTVIISSIAPMTVAVRVKSVPAQPRSGAAMPTSKSDLASRASMVTG